MCNPIDGSILQKYDNLLSTKFDKIA